MEKINYTTEVVRHHLQTSQAWVEKAIIKLFELQTADEQRAEITKHVNGKGFNSCDSKKLSYYAKWLHSGRHLTGPHLQKAHKIVPKYAGQIVHLINQKQTG